MFDRCQTLVLGKDRQMNLKVEPLFQLLLSAFHRDPRVVEAVAVGNLFTNLNNYEGCCIIVVVEANFGGSLN